MANISAQDTIPLHELSTEVLILSMTSNPLAEFLLGVANFSPSSSPSSRIEPSQPCKSLKKIGGSVKISHNLTMTK